MIKLLAKADNEGHYDYTLLFLSVIGLMIAAVTVLMLTIRERKLVEEMKRHKLWRKRGRGSGKDRDR